MSTKAIFKGFILFIALILNKKVSCTDTCPAMTACDPSYPYRLIDGSCNNLKNSNWGAANTNYLRLCTTNYTKFGDPKTCRNNSVEIRRTCFPDKDVPDPKFTLINMVHGQFVIHDLASTLNKPNVTCNCTNLNFTMNCMPMVLPPNDPRNSKCLNYVRSDRNECPSQTEMTYNSQTHWLDLSHVYGINAEQTKIIRAFKEGLLNSAFINQQIFPPLKPFGCVNCTNSTAKYCFEGEARMNQQPWLTTMHIVFLRAHNRIAKALRKVNPSWKDERLFQEARRILTAIWQLICYQQWLPYIVGKDMMTNKNLNIRTDGYPDPKGYKSDKNPTLSLEFLTGCYRYYHTMIPDNIPLYSAPYTRESSEKLSDHYNNPDLCVYNFDKLLSGIAYGPMQKTDSHNSAQISEFLFKFCKPFGSDLPATDIHRACDHEVGSYTCAMQLAGLKRAYTFDDLKDVIKNDQDRKNLQKFYDSLYDVPLIVAANMETLVPGCLAGPTCRYIIADQFQKIKEGDRFFFTNPGDGFTRDQRLEILKCSFLSLFCENSNIKEFQPNIWELPSEKSNKPISCAQVPKMDFSPFKE